MSKFKWTVIFLNVCFLLILLTFMLNGNDKESEVTENMRTFIENEKIIRGEFYQILSLTSITDEDNRLRLGFINNLRNAEKLLYHNELLYHRTLAHIPIELKSFNEDGLNLVNELWISASKEQINESQITRIKEYVETQSFIIKEIQKTNRLWEREPDEISEILKNIVNEAVNEMISKNKSALPTRVINHESK